MCHLTEPYLSNVPSCIEDKPSSLCKSIDVISEIQQTRSGPVKTGRFSPDARQHHFLWSILNCWIQSRFYDKTVRVGYLLTSKKRKRRVLRRNSCDMSTKVFVVVLNGAIEIAKPSTQTWKYKARVWFKQSEFRDGFTTDGTRLTTTRMPNWRRMDASRLSTKRVAWNEQIMRQYFLSFVGRIGMVSTIAISWSFLTCLSGVCLTNEKMMTIAVYLTSLGF